MATVGPISQYDILRKLARGGMGEVYLARQTGIAGFAKEVVIKRIHSNFAEEPQFVSMFLQEARIAALLDHPNIVQIYELGKQGNDYFIVMEYVRGLSLSRMMKAANAALPIPSAIQIAAGVAAGLQFAHERKDPNGVPLNLVHRDISPPNILLSTSGSVKITDFGIAKIRQSVTQTQAGVIKGKWSYISPEQARGDPASPQSDIYSLGLVLYEMTTGVRAYPPGNDKALLRAVANGQVPPPELHVTNYPEDLREVLMRAIEPDPRNRYRECQELQDELLALLVSRQIVTSPAKLGQFVQRFVDDPTPVEEPQVGAPIPTNQPELVPDDVVAVAPIETLEQDMGGLASVPTAPEIFGPLDDPLAPTDTLDSMEPMGARETLDPDLADTLAPGRAPVTLDSRDLDDTLDPRRAPETLDPDLADTLAPGRAPVTIDPDLADTMSPGRAPETLDSRDLDDTPGRAPETLDSRDLDDTMNAGQAQETLDPNLDLGYSAADEPRAAPPPSLPSFSSDFDDDAETIMLDRAASRSLGFGEVAAGQSTDEGPPRSAPLHAPADAPDMALLRGMATFEQDSSVESWDDELAARGAPPPAQEPTSGSLTGAAGEVSVATDRPPRVWPWLTLMALLALGGTVVTWFLLTREPPQLNAAVVPPAPVVAPRDAGPGSAADGSTPDTTRPDLGDDRQR